MPDDSVAQPSPEGDDPLAALQVRFSASLDRAQMMLDRVTEVLAPLDTLPDLGSPADEPRASGIEAALGQLAEPSAPGDAAPADAALPRSDGVAAAAAREVSRLAPRSPVASSAAESLRPRRPGTPTTSGGEPSGAVTFLRQQMEQRFDTPLLRFLESQQQAPAGHSALEDFAQAVSAATSGRTIGAATPSTSARARELAAPGGVARGNDVSPDAASQDSSVRARRSRKAARSTSIPSLSLSTADGRSSPRRTDSDSTRLLGELQEGQQQLLRDVAELKRKPAVWGEAR